MRNVKKNQNGFTLVELIVVVSLMAIVFGALMNVIKPTNKFFDETEAFKDEVMISEGLTDALASEIRYSTNVVVLKNYVGVPKISADGQIEGVPDIKFDSAIMLESRYTRGCFSSDWTSNAQSTLSRRKGAKGQIILFELIGNGINFNTSNILYNENYYADYEYEFTVDGKNDENGRAYIDFGVTMNDLDREDDGSYSSNEDNYESSEFLYLKNINIDDNDGYRLYVFDFHNSVSDDDYVGFERATVSEATASTQLQKDVFAKDDADNVHTWIIYYKGGTIDAKSNVTLTFDPKEGGIDPVEITCNTGKSFNQTPPTFPLPGYDLYEENGKTYTRRFVGWLSTTNPTEKPLTNEEMMAYIPVSNESFYAVYASADITYDVTFYDQYGSVIQKDVNIIHGSKITPPDMSNTLPDPTYDYMWKIKGTTASIVYDSAFDSISESMELEPHYFHFHNVRFFNENGNLIHADLVISGTALTNIPEVPEKPGYTGVWMQENSDGTLSTPIFSTINESADYIAVYTPIPANKPDIKLEITRVEDATWGTPVNILYLNISNVGEADAKGFKIELPMIGSVSAINGFWGGISSYGNVTVTPENNNIIINCTGTIPAGASGDITIQATVSEWGVNTAVQPTITVKDK